MASVGFEALEKRYGATRVVRGIDLDVADGEFAVLVGPSGCGKSTTLRMVAGLEAISAGTIRIGGRVVNALPPRARDVAMVFQDYALYPHKTVFENMAFGLRARRMAEPEIRARIAEASAMLGLDALLARMPRALSGGQRQRVAMGRAIVRRPALFLFDEPLSNLDAKLRTQVRAEIKRLHRATGTTILYVTHDQVEAMTLADRIVIMRGGAIEQVGTPDEVYADPDSTFVAGFVGSPPMNLIPARREGGEIVLGGHRLPVTIAGGDDDVILGLRSEDFVAAGADGMPQIVGRVDVVEPLGADTLVHLEIDHRSGRGRIVCRMPPATRPRPGSDFAAAFHPERLCLFDAATERRIR